MGLLKRLLRGRQQRRFFAWQVELTTRCPLRCRMCVRSSGAEWQPMDMHIDDFRKISKYFHEVEAVVLEGWGEPLLYEHLLTAVRLVAETGAKPGFVTSTAGLNESVVGDLIEAGIDFMGISLAGVTQETHGSIRIHSGLDQIIQSVRLIEAAKKRTKSAKPRLHFVYLLLKENLIEVPLLPAFARDLGITDVVLMHPVHIGHEWLESQRLFVRSEAEPSETAARLEETAKRALELGVTLRMVPLTPQMVGVCAENPLRNLYVSVEGDVTPCVYLNPPVRGSLQRIFCGKVHIMPKVTFGNLFEQPLAEIWDGEAYKRFRSTFAARGRGLQLLLFPGWSGRQALNEANQLTPPPQPCLSCHKMLGF